MNDPIKDIEAELKRRIAKVGIHLVNTMKEKVNEAQPYEISNGSAGKHYKGLDPSQPDNPPKKITGHLQRSITAEPTNGGLGVKVGSSVEYAKFLELGTVTMQPRPFIRNTIKEQQGKIDAMMGDK